MILLNDFFTIEKEDTQEDTIIFDIKLNKSHAVYEGHFPKQPIAPGVCLAQMIKEICATKVGSSLKLKESRNMKFMAVLNPFEQEIVQVEMKIKEENEIFSVKANCKNNEKSFFKIDAKYIK